MQPQLVTDLTGLNSRDLEKTVARLVKGATWKKQRIIIILPADKMIPAKVALSHWNLAFPPNNNVLRYLAQGMEVGHAYTSALEQILAHPELNQWEYILTIEHDNMPPQDGLLKLLAKMDERKDLSAISGLYFTKGVEGVAQIWGDTKDPVTNFRPQVPVPNQLVECCGTGMGFTLFRLSMFKDPRLRKPWFKTLSGSSGMATQDLYFWEDARKYGHKCAVDCSIPVGHYDMENDIVW